jgi:NitT/TauT family transport system permease protein
MLGEATGSPPSAPASAARRRRRLFVRYGLPLLTLVVAVVLWEVGARALGLPKWLLPAPSAAFLETLDRAGELPMHTWVTFYETVLGFGLAVVIGVLLAVVIVYSPLLEATILPLLVVTQAVPKVALAPLLLLWIGYGDAPKILIAFLVSFFPIVVNVATGLKAIEPEVIDLSRSLSASQWDTFWKVRLPASLPYFFSGTKVAVTLSLIGAVIGEFVGADRGLGYLIVLSSAHVNTSLAFGAIFVLSVLGIVLYFSVEWAERVLCPWASD